VGGSADDSASDDGAGWDIVIICTTTEAPESNLGTGAKAVLVAQ